MRRRVGGWSVDDDQVDDWVGHSIRVIGCGQSRENERIRQRISDKVPLICDIVTRLSSTNIVTNYLSSGTGTHLVIWPDNSMITSCPDTRQSSDNLQSQETGLFTGAGIYFVAITRNLFPFKYYFYCCHQEQLWIDQLTGRWVCHTFHKCTAQTTLTAEGIRIAIRYQKRDIYSGIRWLR